MKLWDNDGQCSLIFFPYHSVDFRMFQNPRINNEVGLSIFDLDQRSVQWSTDVLKLRYFPCLSWADRGTSWGTRHFNPWLTKKRKPSKDIRYDEKNSDWNKETISYSTASWWVYKRQNGISWICISSLAIWQKRLVQGLGSKFRHQNYLVCTTNTG